MGQDQPRRWERINHDEDQTGGCRARECGAGRCALCCRSEEVQASQALCFDHAIRNLWDVRNVDDARSLWDIRNFCWNSHCSFSGLVQLAVGRRDKRGPHLEQHQSARALGRHNADAVPWKDRAAHRGNRVRDPARPPCSMTTLLITALSRASAMGSRADVGVHVVVANAPTESRPGRCKPRRRSCTTTCPSGHRQTGHMRPFPSLDP